MAQLPPPLPEGASRSQLVSTWSLRIRWRVEWIWEAEPTDQSYMNTSNTFLLLQKHLQRIRCLKRLCRRFSGRITLFTDADYVNKMSRFMHDKALIRDMAGSITPRREWYCKNIEFTPQLQSYLAGCNRLCVSHRPSWDETRQRASRFGFRAELEVI